MRLSTERNITIDVAKGISIILVAFGHSQLQRYHPDVHASLGLIRMPLFFFLSGVFLSSALTPRAFLIKKTDALLKPYFVTLGIATIMYSLLGEPNIRLYIFGILYGTGQSLGKFWMALWFLPHLWVVCLAAFAVHKYSPIARLPTSTQILICLMMLITGGYLIGEFKVIDFSYVDGSTHVTGLPFSVDLLLVTLSYFLAGSALNSQVKSFRPKTVFVIACLFVFACILMYTGAFIELNSRQYNEPVWSVIGSFAGIYLMLTIAYLLSQTPHIGRWLMTAGYASLFILLFHGLIKSLTYRPLVKLVGKDHKIVAALVAFGLSIILPLAIKWLVERNALLRKLYLPEKKTA